MVAIKGGKRRRLEEEPRSRRHEQPPGEREGDGPALISHLPDEILGEIITLLPTAEGVRTQILSRRWRPLWCAAPLNLEAEVAAGGKAGRGPDLGLLLCDHQGPVRRLSLRWRRSFEHFSIVDSMLQSPRLDNLQELEIYSSSYNSNYSDAARWHQIPNSVLRFTATLRVLAICLKINREIIQFTPETASSLGFPHLKQLTLSRVYISENSLHGILRRCPVIESLALLMNTGYGCLRISSPTLRSLGTSVGLPDKHGVLEELVIENAPLLERLHHRRSDPFTIRIIQAPKLKALGKLRDQISFEFGALVLQKLVPVGLPNVIRTVKILALGSPCMDRVIGLLKCFPCVQKLHMKYPYGNKENVQCCVPFECLDLHLKMLEIQEYHEGLHACLVRFFVLNARVLESIQLVVSRGECAETWITRQHMMLQLENRASHSVKVEFNAGKPPGHSHMKHIHDMDIDDPFDTILCKCH